MTEQPPTLTPLHIAMWSGPRNISTALLRAWGNRPDTAVCDEPFYAHYLQQTGVPHPGRDEVITHHDTDWRRVAAGLLGPVPGGQAIFYQKHMAHHLLPGMDRVWLLHMANAFLIREPRAMLTSLIKVTPQPQLADTGLPQQVELFEMVRRATGHTPPVIDARDVLDDPRRLLTLLCQALGVAFDEAMLHWPPGPRPTDGIWAKYWYAEVEKSTSFHPYTPKPDPVPGHLTGLLEECEELYERLHAERLGV